ncbi:DUF4870 family protein [Sphingosinicella microcystinivorans]|uniref:DUF4870 family protein n=1 Tax=Sphingosinicella microcystinivorans TaxID=335406 RepID=UPI0022F3D39C|nr:hypothetical protein [Sphingosinicella microcystinivorans]WBX85453.1 hypothetical protein PE061_05880 [Sphingosinicella microcystinivorans]
MASRPEAQGFDLNRPTIVALLILVGAVSGLPTLVGAILAYIWRGAAENAPWEESHFAYHIRGFWITVVAVIALAVLSILTLGLLAPLFGLVSIWLVVRAIVSIAKAQRREPMPDPNTYLW